MLIYLSCANFISRRKGSECKLHLEEEGIRVSKTSLCMLLKKYKETGMVADQFRPCSQAKKLQLVNSDYNQVHQAAWVSSLPHYCLMIRENNKWKRLLWLQQTINGEKFKDVIWSECSMMIERNRKTCRRVGQPRKFKPKPKHPLKVAAT